MTNTEKIEALKLQMAPDTAEEGVLTSVLSAAEALILTRMYPFGCPEGKEVPAMYERIQVALAVELYNKRGVEGQTTHSENGISRTWPETSRLLNRIMPHVGSVCSDA